jgi:hypothetical protein
MSCLELKRELREITGREAELAQLSLPTLEGVPIEKPRSASVVQVKGARVHNLKNVDVSLPRDSLVVFTGLSGSGKSSLAFDTIFAEGQRRYVESLSAYARQFLGQVDRPDVDVIEGLSPAVSIDQKSTNETRVPLWEQSPRSMTISVCCGREQEFPTVSSVESRSVVKASKTLPTAFLRAKLGGVFRFLLP